ncbi:hypothetical protein [Sinomicrobium sp. M5D2P17]
MKKSEYYGVQELNEVELQNINGGVSIGDALELINGILDIVLSFMNAAIAAVEDYVNDFLNGQG